MAIPGLIESKKGSQSVKRLIISVEGRERVGKTSFGLSAPGPLAFFPIDPGREGVLDKYLASKKIYLPVDEKGKIETFSYKDATNQKEYERIWEKFKGLFFKVLDAKEIRSIIIDTNSEAWELIRLARFGKLTQVMPHHYGPVNTEFRDMIKKVYDTDKNLILIHKVKAEYINDKRTGEVERAGFSDIGYLVQINLVLTWNQEDGFGMTIRDCRQNMTIAGMTVTEPLNTFQFLATQVYPSTDESDWE